MEDYNFTVTEVDFALKKVYQPNHSWVAQGRKSNGLTMVLTGELKLTFPDGSNFIAKENDVILQRKGDFYTLEAVGKEKSEYIVISYHAESESILLSLLSETRVFTPVHRTRFKDAFERAVSVNKSLGICKKTLNRAIVQEMICNIARELYPDVADKQSTPIESAKFYIDEFYDRKISVSDIANVAGFSVSHLRVLFKNAYGQSPVQYLNTVRVERAKEMLESNLFSIEEVACACGFQNVYYFNRVFKLYIGTTPGKYSKNNRKV